MWPYKQSFGRLNYKNSLSVNALHSKTIRLQTFVVGKIETAGELLHPPISFRLYAAKTRYFYAA